MAKKAKKTAKIPDPQLNPIESASHDAPKVVAQAGGPATEIAAQIPDQILDPILDPIGDTADGEALAYLGDQSPIEDSFEPADADSNTEAAEAGPDAPDADPEFTPDPRPPANLERLQKILSKAGVASRRKAEEFIEQGRVQVNGKVVTELGTKADAARDHIRVDGKLLHGAERLRYFVLNKPRGFVTTVKDPEGRPTVMQFFEKMRERLYPVGRLDYMSEGLLLVTNDGELANRLTKAGSGVEKVYLVKVAGQPSESELDILRGGVSIERDSPGSPRVRTSPARVRQVRQGDNPWYEVVLIEGRNRELRKMFSAIGHFVEKIRRVGYGPLVLDQEPGNFRELEPAELAKLLLAAEGKLRTPKAKDVRRRNLEDAGLPTVAPKPSRVRPAKPFEPRAIAPSDLETGAAPTRRSGEFASRRPFEAQKPFRTGSKPAKSGASKAKFGTESPKYTPKSAKFGAKPGRFASPRPEWKKDDRPTSARKYNERPAASRSFANKPSAARDFAAKPAWKKPERQPWQPNKRPPAAAPRTDNFAAAKPSGLRIDPIGEDDRSAPPRPTSSRPASGSRSYVRPFPDRRSPDRGNFDRSSTNRRSPDRSSGRSGADRARPFRPSSGRPGPDRFSPDRPRTGARPASGRAGGARPPRPEGTLPRPFTTSSGKPRAGGARPSSKPFKPGGSTSSGYKGKPGGSGPKRTGPKRPDSRPGGKKRS